MRSRKRLRVAVLTYATQPRGGVVHARALAEAMHVLGHEAVLFAIDRPGSDFARPPRCRYRRVEVGEPRTGTAREDTLAFARNRIEAYVRYFETSAETFDVYHAQDGISGNALATLAERGRIGGFARTVHHVEDFAEPELAALQQRSIVCAQQHFVVSALWRDALRARYGIDARVVPSGVDPRRFRPAPPAERSVLRQAAASGTGPLFLTIGGIEARKNTLATLEAFALVRAALPEARLVIAGGASVLEHGAYRRAFDARRAELGLATDESVVVAGVRSDAEIVALYRAADAFVFPSLVEGFGLVLLEALACGTPVVASNIAPFTEFLGARSALLVDPRSPAAIARAMRRALRPETAHRLRANGRVVAQAHTWEACAGSHVAHYQRAYETAV